jgi:hypothetical protein
VLAVEAKDTCPVLAVEPAVKYVPVIPEVTTVG